ncbi:MAG: hypothetical protein IJQ57_10880 [Synergistaceae bacterium]|nr:hypothetical protein [Synergistaceae bacterium]
MFDVSVVFKKSLRLFAGVVALSQLLCSYSASLEVYLISVTVRVLLISLSSLTLWSPLAITYHDVAKAVPPPS